MAKMGCFLGVALIGLAVVLMVGLIALPIMAEPDNDDQATRWLETLLCKSGETYTQEEYTIRDSTGTSTNINMYCADAIGDTRSVTGRMILITGASFVVPFLLGMTLIMFSASWLTRNKVQTFLDGAQFVTTPDGKVKRSPAEKFKRTGRTQWDMGGTQVSVDPRSGQMQIDGQVIQAAGASNDETLSERLQELEDALKKRLITREEYYRLRQRILDEEGS
ncbi:MAG: hypothetical protein K8S97_04955 [Anaerolineae bacterium]|nr:hypothetical protein [Anaerolineae bacterium]